ncbi:phosphotransferase [Flexivirga meconopsidis]|uniref:phosphotransferase n=1 Tax=Flexivirga meconopsidis TaxID=2977121 RepID=UPI00223F5352
MIAPDLSAWGLPTPTQVRAPEHGTNNEVRLVTSGEERFVWRQYENLRVEQVRREHALLGWLGRQGLPFAVPEPLTTRAGATFARHADGRAISVHRFIPGRRPTRDDTEIALTAMAFATLVRVLGAAPTDVAMRDWTSTGLTEIHPGSRDIEALLGRLDDEGVDSGWLRDVLSSDADVRRRSAHLPRQVVHGDIAMSNALIEDGVITGLLDFEISGWDCRASDVATAMLTLGGDPWTERGRSQIALVHEIFDQTLDLTRDETWLLPELVLRRLAGSVVWRAGRWSAGSADIGEVAGRVHDGAAHVASVDAYRPR